MTGKKTFSQMPLTVWVDTGGVPAPSEQTAGRTVTLTLTSAHPEHVAEAVRSTGLRVPDLMTSVTVTSASGCDPALFCVAHLTMSTIAGRVLAASDGRRVAEFEMLDRKLRSIPKGPRPSHVDPVVQVGGGHEEIPCMSLSEGDTETAMSRVRNAKVARLAVGTDFVSAAASMVAMTALRARTGNERPPVLVGGDEPEGSGVDLVDVLSMASSLRKQLRTQTVAEVVEREVAPARLERLAEADRLDIEKVMELLGARRSADGKPVWHCPRPSRHTNGDRVPSMKAGDGTARCMRCDAERVGPVRLAADTWNMSTFEAAEVLLEKLGS